MLAKAGRVKQRPAEAGRGNHRQAQASRGQHRQADAGRGKYRQAQTEMDLDASDEFTKVIRSRRSSARHTRHGDGVNERVRALQSNDEG